MIYKISISLLLLLAVSNIYCSYEQKQVKAHKHSPVIAHLIKAGQQKGQPEQVSPTQAKSKECLISEQFSLPLIEAILEKNFSKIKLLVSQATIRKSLGQRGASGLHINAKDNSGHTALMWAVANSMPQVVGLLLAVQDIDLNSKDKDGLTALDIALTTGDQEITHMLVSAYQSALSSCKPDNVTDKRGFSTLFRAVKSNNSDVVKLLIDSGAKLDVSIQDKDGFTILDTAIAKNNKKILNLLVAACKANPDKCNLKNCTNPKRYISLAKAVQISDIELVRLLLQIGANPTASIAIGDKVVSIEQLVPAGRLDIKNLISAYTQNLAERTQLFMRALHERNLEQANQLLESNIDLRVVNARQRGEGYGRTLLHDAVLAKDTALVELLIKAGAYVEAKDNWYGTPLHMAAQLGYESIVELLINNKADVNAANEYGLSGHPLDKAISYNEKRKEIVELLVKAGANLNSISFDVTPLLKAIELNFKDVVELLIKAGVDVNYKAVLHEAAIRGNKEIMQMLLDAKADVNAKDFYGYTPLLCVTRRQPLDVIELLINNKADVNLKSASSTPLMGAAGSGNIKKVALLIKMGADVNDENKFGYTPMTEAVASGNKDIVQLLINNKALVNAKSDGGYALLYDAARDGFIDIIRLLVNNKADVKSKNKDGWTPLHVAAGKGHLRVMQLLIDNQADVNAKTDSGDTPLHWACQETVFYRTVEKTNKAVIQLLFDKKANVNAYGYIGTPLHTAAHERNTEIVQMLIEAKADVAVKDKWGKTLLMLL